jgi:hypothetical protein
MAVTVNFNNVGFDQFPALYGSGVMAVSAGVNWTRSLGEGKTLLLSGDLGVYSDLVNLSSGAIREKLGLTYIRRYSPRLSLGFGLEYRNQLFGNQLIPVVAVFYNSQGAGHWRFSGVLPYNPRLSYSFDKKNAISLELKQSFGSYQLTAAANNGDYLKTQLIAGQLNYEYRFGPHWRLNAGVGVAAQQKYAVYSGQGSGEWWLINTPLGHHPDALETVSKGGLQLNIGLVFNPKF